MRKEPMRILFIGDVVGRPGREALENNLPLLEQEYDIDFTIVNGENATGGFGMDLKAYTALTSAGADALTMGNHTFDNKKIFNFIDEKDNIVRPLNLTAKAPGAGVRRFTLKNGASLAVVNLCGRVYSNMSLNCPFQAMEEVLKDLSLAETAIFVDFHADATSEKVCFGHYFDGRVSAVCGTHTHIQTADEKILSRGTAYITDAGMTGAYDSCLGMTKEAAISRFTQLRRQIMRPAPGERQINGVVVTLNDEHKAESIERISRICPEF